MLRDLGDPEITSDLLERRKSELSALIRRLAEMAYPGEPVTGNSWLERMALVAEDVDEDLRVQDWSRPVSIGRIMAHTKAARRLIAFVEQIVALEW